MTESHIGRVVHAAFQNETSLYSDSVFNDQRFRGFFAQIKDIVNEVFQSLYDTVHNEYSDLSERKMKFAKGLDFIKNEIITVEELSRIKENHPSIELEYQRSFIRYAQSVSEANQKVKIPTFDKFLTDLYKRVANSLEFKSGRYFTRLTYLEQELALKDILRITMSANIRFEQERAVVPDRVLPSDSASNITSRVGGGGSRNSVLEKALSAVRENGGLTEMDLHRHKSEMARSRAHNMDPPVPVSRSKFKTPSVMKTSQIKEERVVSIKNKPDSPRKDKAPQSQDGFYHSSDGEEEYSD